MREGPKDSEKAHHAELSERLPTVDTWGDIPRKTFAVAIVSFTVYYLLGECGLYGGPSVTVYVATGMAAA